MRRNALHSNAIQARQFACSRGLTRGTSSPLTFRRWAQVSPNLAPDASRADGAAITAQPRPLDGPDAKFEVLGAPYSMLSATLSASQNLYTRRGTLVGLSGKPENVVSTLSMFEPFRRAALGIPFFYQKITSATPVTALLATRSPISSFAVVHLDGTTDWTVSQRDGLLAWTGQTLSVTPTMNTKLNIGHWGSSTLTGRGLVALAGKGQIYEVVLRDGEQYVVHPSHVLAYTRSRERPMPYRFKSSVLRFEVPGLGNVARRLPDTNFFRVMRDSPTWRRIANAWLTLRTWSRRTVFGDRLFLQFRGPTTILLQTRGSRLGDSLSTREVNEIAEAPAGAIQDAIREDVKREQADKAPAAPASSPTTVSYAGVRKDGSVQFTAADRLSSG